MSTELENMQTDNFRSKFHSEIKKNKSDQDTKQEHQQ